MSGFFNELQANNVYTQTLVAQDGIDTPQITMNGVLLDSIISDVTPLAGTGLLKSNNTFSINPNQTLTSLTTTGNINLPLGNTLRFTRMDGSVGQSSLGCEPTVQHQFNIKNLTGGALINIETVANGNVDFTGAIVNIKNTTDSGSPTTGALKIAGGVGISKNMIVGGNIQMGGVGEFRIDYPNIGAGRLLIDNMGDMFLNRGVLSVLCPNDTNSLTTGALKVAGGVAITKSLQVGANLTVNGNGTLSNLVVSGTSNFTGLATLSALTITSNVNQPFNLSMSTTASAGSVSAFSNYLKPAMGANETSSVGFGQSNSARNMGYLGYTFVANNSNNNCITIGLHSVDRIFNVYGDGRVQVTTTSDSSNSSNGSFIVSGGAGIGKNLYVGGNLNITGSVTASNLDVSSGVNTTDYVSFGGITPTTITQKEIYFSKVGKICNYSARIAYTASTGTWNGYVFIKTQHPSAYRDRYVKVVYQFAQYYYEAWGYVRFDDASKGLVMNVDPAPINALNPSAGEWLFSWSFQTV